MLKKLLFIVVAIPGVAWCGGAEELGRRAFELCAACHSLVADEQRVGPSLHGLIGRAAGKEVGFRYSGPMKRSGVVWNEEALSDFLKNPQEKIPGNRMPFSGITDDATLKALIGYLKQATQ